MASKHIQIRAGQSITLATAISQCSQTLHYMIVYLQDMALKRRLDLIHPDAWGLIFIKQIQQLVLKNRQTPLLQPVYWEVIEY